MINAFKRTFGFINNHPLAKRHIAYAYFKFIIWQLKCRINKNLQPVKFINQISFYARKNLTGITGNIYTGLHEFEDMAFLLHFLRKEDLFFDVGANVGAYTLLASGVCRSKSISFEPVQSTFNILLKNIELNKLNNLVKAENKGVGSKSGYLTFTATEDTTNHIVADDYKNAIKVPMVHLDEYYEMQKPILIKIDVEGFETEVLNGASKILTSETLKAIIIELNGSGERYGFDDHLIHEKLKNLFFTPYSYNPFNRVLSEIESFGSHNTIYIRDVDFVKNRIETAQKFIVFNEKI